MAPSLSPALLVPGVLEAAALSVKKRQQARALGGPTAHLSPEDRDLYAECRTNLPKFAKTFLGHWCGDDFNRLHLDYYAAYLAKPHRRFHAVSAPRGHAKTVGCALITILHSCVYQLEPYTIYLTYRHEDAVNKVRDLRDELESNADLLRVYGAQQSADWNNADWTTRHGMRVRAASAHTQLRGALAHGQRPSRVFIDDGEHAERVLNVDQRAKTWDWLTKEILHLGSPETNYDIFGTILHEEGMLKTLFTTPGWTTQAYQAVEQLPHPASIPLWQQWRALYLDLSHPDREAEAQAFYEAHEAAMLQDHRVLWPTRRPYIDLMQSRLREGESSYWQELQGLPLGDQRYIFQMDTAAYCTISPQGITRAGGTFVPWTDIVEVVAAYDPVPDKAEGTLGDYAAVPVLAQDRQGYLYCLDAYLERQDSVERQTAAIVDLVWKWDIGTMGIETNGFMSLLPNNIREAVAARAAQEHTPEFQVHLVSITNMRSKVLRIKSLEPLVLNGWLQFATTLPPEAIRQMAQFIPVDNAGLDDFADSLEMAVRVIRHQYERRDIV
jgi:hypothetical protein